MASGGQQSRRGRKRRVSRKRQSHQARPSFYVHHTDNDMILLISSQDGESPRRRERKVDNNPTVSEPPPSDLPYSGWGSSMPLEILQRIFHFVTGSDGAIPALCRLSRVCRRWSQAASSPVLWQRVSLGFCWVDPGKKQPPKLQTKIRDTVENLIKERLTLLSEFSLHHWKEQVPFVLETVSGFCPRLSSLTLSYCTGVTANSLITLVRNCPQLSSLNLQNSQVEPLAVLGALDICGFRMQRLFLTYSNRLNAIVNSLAGGSCPELRVLELNTEMKQGENHLQICIETLQSGCPKLQVLRLLNLVWSPKSRGRCCQEPVGFVHLQELCLATSSYSFVSDSVCQSLLQGSLGLKMLDLRGCYRVTPAGICQLPCTDLDRLYLGLYCSTKNLALPRTGCLLLARRWQHSLQELDVTAQGYSEEDLSEALTVLCKGGTNETLRSLNLAGTKVTSSAVRELLTSCPSLTHLDLSSCRYLPRGMKRVYRGVEDVHQCLAALNEDFLKVAETQRDA